MRKAKVLTVAVACTTIVVLGASSSMAGEGTGSGKKQDQNQGRSWCSFSGLHDRLPGQGPVEPRAQSYGIEVKLGLANPHEATPGFFCNPNRTPLPPNPNRTK